MIHGDEVKGGFLFPEAAMRALKQADSEDCDKVHIEHFEKILPQLVGHRKDLSMTQCFNTVCLPVFIHCVYRYRLC